MLIESLLSGIWILALVCLGVLGVRAERETEALRKQNLELEAKLENLSRDLIEICILEAGAYRIADSGIVNKVVT